MCKEKDVLIYRGESVQHEFIVPTALRDRAFDDPRTVVDKNCAKRYDFTLGGTFLRFNHVHEDAYKCCFLSFANFFLQVQNEIKHGSPKNAFYEICRSSFAKKLLNINTKKKLLDMCYEYSKHIFNGPVFDNETDICTQFNNLFLTMSEYQHLNAFQKSNPTVYFPSMMLDFTECISIAENFAKKYGQNGIIYSANYSRISELLRFRPDFYNALTSNKFTKTSELNLSLLSVAHWPESNNEVFRKEKAINIFWPWKITKNEIGQIYSQGTVGYVLDLQAVSKPVLTENLEMSLRKLGKGK